MFPLLLLALSFFPGGENPKLKVEHPAAAAQGQFLRVQFSPQESSQNKLNLHFLSKTVPCYAESGKGDCLAAVPADAKTGKQKLKLLIRGKTVYTAEVKITPTWFPTEPLPLTPEKKSLLTRQDRPQEEKIIHQALATESPKKLWEGRFIQPMDGMIESHYGERRTVDGKLRKNYYHRGLDWGAPLGTTIQSSNHGNVILAGPFIEEGNMVMVDHGQGIVSAYLHMSEILVKAGQAVEKGDILGKVGDTGVANSTHLHFGTYIHGIPIDPVFWLKERFSGTHQSRSMSNEKINRRRAS